MEILAMIGCLLLFILGMILLVLSTKHKHCMKCIYNESHTECSNDTHDNTCDKWEK